MTKKCSSLLRLLDIGGITEWKSVHDRCSELVVYSCGWLTLSNLNFTKQKLVAESILSYDWEIRNWRSAEINNRVIKRVDHPQLVQCNQHQDSVSDCQSVIPCLYKILSSLHLLYIQPKTKLYNQKPFYEAKCWFSRRHFTSIEYCNKSAKPKISTHWWELLKEVLYKDFPQGACKLPVVKAKSSEKFTFC